MMINMTKNYGELVGNIDAAMVKRQEISWLNCLRLIRCHSTRVRPVV